MCGCADVQISDVKCVNSKKNAPGRYRGAFIIYLHKLHKPAAHSTFVQWQWALHSVVHFLFVHFVQSPGFANADMVNIVAIANTMNFFMILNFNKLLIPVNMHVIHKQTGLIIQAFGGRH